MSCSKVSKSKQKQAADLLDLLESLVIDETGAIFWYVELPFLQVFAELPGSEGPMSGSTVTRARRDNL